MTLFRPIICITRKVWLIQYSSPFHALLFPAFQVRLLLLPSNQVELPRECIYICPNAPFSLSPVPLPSLPIHPTSGPPLDNVIISVND